MRTDPTKSLIAPAWRELDKNFPMEGTAIDSISADMPKTTMSSTSVNPFSFRMTPSLSLFSITSPSNERTAWTESYVGCALGDETTVKFGGITWLAAGITVNHARFFQRDGALVIVKCAAATIVD
jgi:hypothetical protein